jgi:hypothetical protein
MDKIYIVNSYFDCMIELNFENLFFILDNIKYKFKIINKNQLYIYWLNNEYEIYYTEDSFIYYTDILLLKNKIKLIYLTNEEWYDQCIINIEKKIIIRYKISNEKGNIILTKNGIIIEWEKWGREIYNSVNEIYYFKDNINLIENYEEKNELKIPIHIFIHVCCIENWYEILEEQLKLIKNTGLYDIVEKIHFGIVGNNENIEYNIFNDNKYNIMYFDKNIFLYETHTINNIKCFCEKKKEEIYILYIHTKGVRKSGNEMTVKSWRKMMEYFLIEKYRECIYYLKDYDSLGNNVINSKCVSAENASINTKHFLHYSGNFWWSKKSYIDKLEYLPIEYVKNKSDKTRFKAENWILSNYPNCNIGYIYQDNTNTHPYNKYVFENYKNFPFYVKKLKDNI